MSERKRRPAVTDEGRESQLVSLTLDLAEEQLRNKTASSQVMTHFLKIGSTRERLERERLEREVELLSAKVEAMASGRRVEELYMEAMRSFREYSGQPEIVEDDEYYDEDY